MKITGSQIGPIAPLSLGKIKKTAPTTSSEAARPTDQIVLSSDVENIEAARNVIRETPEIRQDKVEALQSKVQSGNYHVPAEEIADRILAENRLAKLGQK